jgi:hypothetical protein
MFVSAEQPHSHKYSPTAANVLTPMLHTPGFVFPIFNRNTIKDLNAFTKTVMQCIATLQCETLLLKFINFVNNNTNQCFVTRSD